jgi:DNA-binding CsgD family transcriptional regulator
VRVPAAGGDRQADVMSGADAGPSGRRPDAPIDAAARRALRDLPTPAVHTLRVAAVLGSRFSLDDLSVVLDRPASGLLVDLAEPLRRGVLVSSAADLCFHPASLGDALSDSTPQAVRCALHMQAARNLAAAGRPAQDVARHYLAGAPCGDADAVRWLRRAARRATDHAPASAVELFDAALRVGGDRGPDRDSLHAERGAALAWAGRLHDSESTLRTLLDRPHAPATDVAARRCLARVLTARGRLGEALDLLRTPGAPTGSAAGRAGLIAETALVRVLPANLADAERTARRAEAAARRCRDDPALVVVLSVRGAVAGLRGRPVTALDLIARAAGVAIASPQRAASRLPPHLFEHEVLVDLDRFDEAGRALRHAQDIGEDFGAVVDVPVVHLLAARAHFHAGELANAEQEAGRCLAAAGESETTLPRVGALAVLAHVHEQRGDLAAARDALADADREVEHTGLRVPGGSWLLGAKAAEADARGDPAEAHAWLLRLWAGQRAAGIVSERRLIGPALVRLYRSVGAVEEAKSVAAAVAEAAAHNPAVRAAALRCQGLADGDAGALLAAVEASRPGPRRLELAATCEDAAATARGSGVARELLREAAACYEAAGAARPLARVDASLRALGVRRGRRRPPPRAAHGWAGLTATEAKVVALAAEGLTNPQIGARLYVSRRTVETHLSHAFVKLGVSSRVELAARVAAAAGRRRVGDGDQRVS